MTPVQSDSVLTRIHMLTPFAFLYASYCAQLAALCGLEPFNEWDEICLPKPARVISCKGMLASSLCSLHGVINPGAHLNTQQVTGPHVHGLRVCLKRLRD